MNEYLYYSDSPTFRLFAVPSFLEGMTMALDYAHTMPEYTTNSNPELTDQIAIASDWRAVGNDLAYAISEIEL